jgi:hypothetical protein
VNINNGSLVKHCTDPDGDIRWCAQPTKFRYYLNSSLDKTLCS